MADWIKKEWYDNLTYDVNLYKELINFSIVWKIAHIRDLSGEFHVELHWCAITLIK